jgi:hypothetical protein
MERGQMTEDMGQTIRRSGDQKIRRSGGKKALACFRFALAENRYSRSVVPLIEAAFHCLIV